MILYIAPLSNKHYIILKKRHLLQNKSCFSFNIQSIHKIYWKNFVFVKALKITYAVHGSTVIVSHAMSNFPMNSAVGFTDVFMEPPLMGEFSGVARKWKV